MSGSSGDILPFYHRALEQGENLRIEEKSLSSNKLNLSHLKQEVLTHELPEQNSS